MTPAEIAALLRIKQVREQRARSVLEAAKRQQMDAVTKRAAAEQAQSTFATESQEAQRVAFAAMDAAGELSATELNALAARLGDMRTEATRLQKRLRETKVAEQRLGSQVATAAGAHGVAMRGAEAFDALKTELLREAAIVADRSEEAETEEPRSVPRSAPRSRA